MVTIPPSLQAKRPQIPKTQYQIYQEKLPKQQAPSKPIQVQATPEQIKEYNRKLSEYKFQQEAVRLANRIIQGKKVSFYTNGQFNQRLADLTHKMVQGTGFYRRGEKDVARFLEQQKQLQEQEAIQEVEASSFSFQKYAEQYGRTPPKFDFQKEAGRQVQTPVPFSFQRYAEQYKQPTPSFDFQQQAREFGRPPRQLKEVTLPTTQVEEYKEAVEERGVVKGTLWYGGQKTSGFISESKYSPFRESGRSRSIGRLGAASVEIAPYFTPAGPVLLVGAGAEELGTPSGRERIREKKKYYEEEKELSPFISGVFAWGEPSAELTLGGFGLSSQIRGIVTTSKLKGTTPKTTFKAETQPITEDVGGISIISRTKLGEYESVGVAGGIYSKTEPTVFIGRGYSISPEVITPTETIGLGRALGEARAVKVVKPVKIKQPVGQAVETKSVTYADEQELSSHLIGSVTKGDSVSYILAGKPKMRIEGGEASTIFRPTIKGTITKAKPTQEVIDFEPFGKPYLGKKPKVKVPKEKPQTLEPPKLKPIQEQQVISIVSGLEKEAKVGIISSVKSAAKVKTVPATGTSLIAPVVKATQKTEQAIASSLSSASLPSTKTETTLVQIDKASTIPVTSLDLVSVQPPKETTRLFIPTTTIQQPKLEPKPRVPTIVPDFSFPGEPKPIKKVPPPVIPIPKKDKFGREQLYKGYVKQQGKWKPITKPLPVKNAWSTASEVVDSTLAAQFRVKPATKQVKGKKKYVYGEVSKFPKPKPHWDQNKKKFRGFVQKKGQRTKVHGGVELQRYRLDSPGEVKKIQRAKSVRNLFGF